MSKKVFKKCLKRKTCKKSVKVDLFICLENKKPAVKSSALLPAEGFLFECFLFARRVPQALENSTRKMKYILDFKSSPVNYSGLLKCLNLNQLFLVGLDFIEGNLALISIKVKRKFS